MIGLHRTPIILLTLHVFPVGFSSRSDRFGLTIELRDHLATIFGLETSELYDPDEVKDVLKNVKGTESMEEVLDLVKEIPAHFFKHFKGRPTEILTWDESH